jgi:hypothetical protein
VFPLIDTTAEFDETYVNAPVLFVAGAVKANAASPTVFEMDVKPEMVGFTLATVIVVVMVPPK